MASGGLSGMTGSGQRHRVEEGAQGRTIWPFRGASARMRPRPSSRGGKMQDTSTGKDRGGLTSRCSPWRTFLWMIAGGVAFSSGAEVARGGQPEGAWRPLPLITGGKLDDGWCHVGYGGFVVDDGALRTECDPKWLGLLVYKKERFGNCQLRVVFKSKDAKSNSGVFVRIADGILQQVERPGAAFDPVPRQ